MSKQSIIVTSHQNQKEAVKAEALYGNDVHRQPIKNTDQNIINQNNQGYHGIWKDQTAYIALIQRGKASMKPFNSVGGYLSGLDALDISEEPNGCSINQSDDIKNIIRE